MENEAGTLFALLFIRQPEDGFGEVEFLGTFDTFGNAVTGFATWLRTEISNRRIYDAILQQIAGQTTVDSINKVLTSYCSYFGHSYSAVAIDIKAHKINEVGMAYGLP